MAREFAEAFYKSKQWKNCRDKYFKSVGGLCENCLAKGIYKPGGIVHHKEHITPDNINNPEVTLAWTNLILVCRDCHAQEHTTKKRRYRFDSDGNLIY